jgi:hypothetical protein
MVELTMCFVFQRTNGFITFRIYTRREDTINIAADPAIEAEDVAAVGELVVVGASGHVTVNSPTVFAAQFP